MAKKDGRRRFGNIRKLPSGRYQASYRGPDGIRRYAPNTFRTEPLAGKWLTLTEADILKGEWTAPEAAEIQLGSYAEKWIRERKLAPRTREIYESIYKLNIKPYLADLTLEVIKPATVRTWRTKLLNDGRPEIQAVKAYRILRAVLNTAVSEDEILKSNPCRIKGFDVQPSGQRPVVGLEQLEALAEAMPARYYALIMLAAFSGLRWGELVALRRGDVDLHNGTVRVARKLIEVKGQLVFGPPKSKAGIRTVTLPKTAVDLVRTHLDLNVGKEDDAMMFTGEKGALLRSSNFRKAVRWPESCQEAGLPEDFHFHDTRHFGNLLAAAAGATTKEMMHRLGQSTMNAALLYQNATDKRARDIAKEMERQLSERRRKDLERQRESMTDEPEDDEDDGSSGALVLVG